MMDKDEASLVPLVVSGNKPLVYLAGPITGQSYAQAVYWRTTAAETLAGVADCLSPMRGKYHLRDETTIKMFYEDYKANPSAILFQDRFDVNRADVIFANCQGAAQVSIGTILEIGWATAQNKPVILVLDEEDKWHDHKMLTESCWVFRDFTEAVIALQQLVSIG